MRACICVYVRWYKRLCLCVDACAYVRICVYICMYTLFESPLLFFIWTLDEHWILHLFIVAHHSPLVTHINGILMIAVSTIAHMGAY